jgi:hypothetical protein
LEIDISDHSSGKCTIKYGKTGSVKILDDMTLAENSANDCLSTSSSGYWLRIASTCLSKEFEISCNKDFVTSLLYEKNTGEAVYVSSESHKSASNGSTKEQVKAKCFKTGNACDYEGSLWTAYALNKLGGNVGAYIPYLTALADDNLRYFPSAFLYSLSASSINNEFYSDIIQKQNKNNLWEISGSVYKKYYDTSLAMLGLINSNAAELETAKSALFESQKNDGCWSERDSIVDTSFLLYSGWSRPVSSSVGGGGNSGEPRCASVNGQSCENKQPCLEAGGQERVNFECSGGTICCSIKVPQQTCAAQKGTLCKSDEVCSEIESASSDGSCCLGSCVKRATTTSYTCTSDVGNCKVSCSSDEQRDDSKTCEIADYQCCREPVSPGNNWFWIIFLIILIILIVLAIIYRDKLRVIWFRYKGKASVSPIVKPGVPPISGNKGMEDFRPSPKFAPVPGRRIVHPGRFQPQVRRPASPKDKELEETLKKLKEMSK